MFLTLALAKETRVQITQGQIDPVPIAVPDFASPGGSEFAQKLPEVVGADLRRSGLFKLIPRDAFIQTASSLQQGPRFADWRAINAQFLLTATVDDSGGHINVEYRVFDVFSGQQVVGQSLSAAEKDWRRLAHKIADQIYKRVTGEEGYFDTRIAFISESGSQKHRNKKLAVMDQDGANVRFLTSGKNMSITPRFNPAGDQVAYMVYENKQAVVYLADVNTGEKKALGKFNGLSFAPNFSPDGRKVIMSLARNGSSAIYTMNMATRQLLRLTNHVAIDTSPCYAPDGSQIVFTSDRSGGPEQLHIMSADGGDIRRISFGEGGYSTPVWSPRGDLIAFTKRYNGAFYIGVMRPDGSGERLLAKGFLVEGPTWSPNGRVIMFARELPGRRGETKIYAIDVTGRNLQNVPTPQDASDPAWSPLLG